MEAQRSTVTVIALSLMVGTAMAAPMALYVISARAVERPAPDLWWLVLLPLVPGAIATITARLRMATAVAVLSVVALTTMAGLMAAYAGDSRASQEAEALQYDDACNTSYSGLSVPFDVDAAFRRVGRVESHHLHGPVSGGFRGCTMAVAGDGDEGFAAWRAQLVGSGWRVVRDDAEVVVARRGVELSLALVDGEAYLTAAETGVDPCHAGRPEPGWVSEPVGDVEAIASPPCS